jgi:glycosyltransferase involved in cell wall biosynthesis
MVIISTHAVFLNDKDIYGPPHAVSFFLNRRKINHVFIKHRLEGDGLSRVEYYTDGKLNRTVERGHPKRFPFSLQYLSEILLTTMIVQEVGRCELFIGVDPLNVLAGNMMKRLSKVKRTVYFSADFALKRFDNPALNNIYLWLDDKGMSWSNETWSVSKRILNYRYKKGLSKDKNKLLPNAPFFDDIKRVNDESINKFDLVIVSAINKEISFNLLIDVLVKIVEKEEKAKLIIIGSGPGEEDLKAYIKEKNMDKNVVMLGALSHEEMFKVLVKCGVGIALYTSADPEHFRYFSDPMKVRDYLASGLPVIVSGNSGIGEEIEERKAGFVVKLEEKDIFSKIYAKLLKNEKIYKEMRQNALSLAKEYDTDKLLNEYLKEIV